MVDRREWVTTYELDKARVHLSASGIPFTIILTEETPLIFSILSLNSSKSNRQQAQWGRDGWIGDVC